MWDLIGKQYRIFFLIIFLPGFDIDDAGNWKKFIFDVSDMRENVECDVGIWDEVFGEPPMLVKSSLGSCECKMVNNRKVLFC